jgi:hypothetical protein
MRVDNTGWILVAQNTGFLGIQSVDEEMVLPIPSVAYVVIFIFHSIFRRNRSELLPAALFWAWTNRIKL